jgi:hypothetical protein
MEGLGTERLNALNREEWLMAVAAGMSPWFSDLGCPLPRVRMAVGFTSRGKRSSRIGECWGADASVDGTHEIFIVPTLDDPVRIADILAHELVHAAVGTSNGHKAPFRKVALAIGLEGRMKATTAGPLFLERVEPILTAVGPLPHARLDWSNGSPKQTTRGLKAYCEHCGYTVRVTAKWLNLAGPPICPMHGVPMIDERMRNFARLRAEMIAAHPDKGGNHEAFIAARAAYERARMTIQRRPANADRH